MHPEDAKAIQVLKKVPGIDRIAEFVMAEGYEAKIYNKKEAWWYAEKLNMIAKLNLTKEERDVLEPLTTYAFSHVTLAEMTVFE